MSIGERRHANGATTIESPAPDLLSQVIEQTAAVRTSLEDIEKMAKKASASRLYAMDDNQAFTLMMIAESEGLHPIQALKRYHIIEGRASMRSDAMQAEFQRHGGRLTWIKSDDKVCEAEFSHPLYQPKPLKIAVTLKELTDSEVAMTWQKKNVNERWVNDYQKPKVLKDTYRKFPRQMLRARVISEGVRAVDPGVIVGIYTPEEVQDFDSPTTEYTPEPQAEVIIERPESDPVDYGPTKERASASISPMMAWLDPFLAKFNDRWRSVLLIENKADAYEPLANPFQVGNHLITSWLETGALDEDEILTDGKRDKLKVKDAFFTAWRQDADEIKSEVADYLNGKLKAAAEAAGVELAEEDRGDAWEPPVEAPE